MVKKLFWGFTKIILVERKLVLFTKRVQGANKSLSLLSLFHLKASGSFKLVKFIKNVRKVGQSCLTVSNHILGGEEGYNTISNPHNVLV